jgi:hypothetical protein
MTLYEKSMGDIIATQIPKIIEEVEKKRQLILEPTLDESKKVQAFIKNFIKNKNRVVYGGYAMNQLLKKKDPKDAIYSGPDGDYLADIEFYSYDPIGDLVNLTNLLSAKFPRVSGREAQHKETYSVFVNFSQYCDISYVPKIVYNNLPVVKIDGISYIAPHFMMIDRLRMLNDPINSYYRLEKDFPRTYKLQKDYPFQIVKNTPKRKAPNNEITGMLKIVFDSLKNSETVVVVGYYAYYTLMGLKHKDIMEKIPFLDIISTSFRNDGYKILKLLKSSYKDPEKITIAEYYPFFQFYGHHVTILIDNHPIINIYHRNNMCIPYQKIKINSDTVQLGTFIYLIMTFLVLQFRMRIESNKEMGYEYEALLSSLLQYRNQYLIKNKKTVFDESLFKEFIINCVGKTIPPDRLYRLQIERKKESKTKGAYNLTYDPIRAKGKFDPTQYKFANTSGNIITNPKNLKFDLKSIETYEMDKPSL